MKKNQPADCTSINLQSCFSLLFLVFLLSFFNEAHAQCSTDADCDDELACTVDDCFTFCFPGFGCNSSCINTSQCDDGNFCTIDSCKASGCVYTPLSCDDNNPCTADQCNNGQCENIFLGNHPCDVPSVCCNDGDACTIDTCDATGACIHVPECTDDDPCTFHTCQGGVCQTIPFDPNACGLSPSCCDDGIDCTVDVCNTAIGLFGACQYGDTCRTQGTDCSTDADCNDGFSCTIDDCFSFCLPGFGCSSGCIYQNLCDDGNFCTIDSCKADGCAYTPVSCDDGNPCTTDACSNNQCVNTFSGSHPCDAPDVCCNDNNPCTNDICDASGACANVPKCADSDPCTSDVCDQGACQYLPFNPNFCVNSPECCDDGMDCTVDFCSATSNIFGTCVSADTCAASGCQTDADCDDELACTIDDCISFSIPGIGSFSDCLNQSQCDDGNFCTIDSCKALGCVYAPVNCDDGNACTEDICSGGVCTHLGDNLDNLPCSGDGNLCIDYRCHSGQCFMDGYHNGDPCSDDGNSCTNDLCWNGNCLHDGHVTDSCSDDGNLCTEDVCNGGACTHPPLSCDDGNACTIDACSPGVGCTNIHPDACADAIELVCGQTVTGSNACATDEPVPSCGGAGGTEGPAQKSLWFGFTGTGGQVTISTCNSTYLTMLAVYTGTCNSLVCHAGGISGDCSTSLQTSVTFCTAAGTHYLILLHTYQGTGTYQLSVTCNDCDDGNACTDDSCDPSTGGCTNQNNSNPCPDDGVICTFDQCYLGACYDPYFLDRVPCEDGNLCMDAICYQGLCVTTTPTTCNDFNDCTDDICDPASGCINSNNNAPCSDGVGCTLNDACSNGYCVPGVIKDCDDGNICSYDHCEGIAAECFHDPGNNGAPCNDGDVCTVNEYCFNTSCTFGTPVDCDDHNACTDDVCVPVTGCVNNPKDCNDNNACTDDGCDPASGCSHTQKDCDDGNACSVDACANGVCVYTPNVGPNCCSFPANCYDDNVCTTDECNEFQCENTMDCRTGGTSCCDDGSACTQDFCDMSTGYCQHKADCLSDINCCNDNDACTFDQCQSHGTYGTCVNINTCTLNACTFNSCTPTIPPVCTFQPVDCSGGNNCIIATCDPVAGCTVTAVDCNDFNACTDDVCSPATGCANIPTTCNDNNACTDDSCDPAIGCINNPKDCNDNNACTIDGCLDNGTCNHFFSCDNNPAFCCDDNDACTFDGCADQTHCVNIPTCNPCDTIDCDDGNACTIDDCNSSCTNTPIDCDDSDTCTIDNCDASLGCVHTANPNCINPCDTLDCDDGNACTDDSCDPASGCIHQNNSNPCADDGNDCTADYCVSGTCYTPEFDFYPCYDLCITGGICEQGLCLHGTPANCDDNDACTVDGCDPASGCSHVPVVCDDNNPCTTDDCDLQTGCVYTTKNCDDGIACTIDTCGNGVCGHDSSGCPKPCEAAFNIALSGLEEVPPVATPATGNLSGTYNAATNTLSISVTFSGLAGTTTAAHFHAPASPGVNAAVQIGLTPGFPIGVTSGSYSNSFILTATQETQLLAGLWYINIHTTLFPGGEIRGQVIIPAICDDGDACTDDDCDQANGCIHTLKDCDDGNLCTDDRCVRGDCAHDPVNCDDGNACTDGSCVPATGCLNVPKNCNDNNACNGVETCNPATGCIPGNPLNCNDSNACNGIETCNPSTGCIPGNPLNCSDGNACNGVETCNPSTGCVLGAPVNCNDGNPCNGVETCNPSNGACIAGVNLPLYTITGFTLVYEHTIGEIGLLMENRVIDKDTLCRFNIRADVCPGIVGSVKFQLTGAQIINKTENIAPYAMMGDAPPYDYNAWIPPVGNYTLKATAYSGPNGSGVSGTPLTVHFSVVDGSGSTATSCSPQQFNCSTLVCDDNNPCTIDGCNPQTGCTFTPKNCNDNNACTTEVCNTGTGNCDYTPVVCNDNNFCTTETCNPGTGCVYAAKDCNDNNACTSDACNPANGNCINIPIVCNDNNPCTSDNCVPATGCRFTSNGSCCTSNAQCSDGDECTSDVCANGSCSHAIAQRVVVSFTLVNSLTDADIGALNHNDVIDLAVYPNINVRANLCTDSGTESIRFKLNSNTNFRTENDIPYALVGDAPPGDYHKWNVTPNTYTITATPYSGNNASGTIGTAKTITIHIINSSAKMGGEEQTPASIGESESVTLSAYPNPFKDVVTISFSLAKTESVKVEIVGIDGRLLATLFDGSADKEEEHRVEFHSGNLSSGMYFYRMITESGLIENRKLLLVR